MANMSPPLPYIKPVIGLLDKLKQYLTQAIPRPAADAGGIVLALGGGGARGLAHIGVLQVLAENNIKVRAIAGTSIGAEIGAFIASGMKIDRLTHVACDFDWKVTLQLFMPDMPTGGITSGKNVIEFLDNHLGTFNIEDLPIPYVAIATDLETGQQVIFDKGKLVDAVRASISIPGFMMPYQIGDRLLIDGGVVNPLPFDVARIRFGGPVVTVAVNAASQRQPQPMAAASPGSNRLAQLLEQPWMNRAPGLRDWLQHHFNNHDNHAASKSFWTLRRVIDRALDISQLELVALRAQMYPPDIIIVPDVSNIGVLEFYEAKAAIQAGREAALQQLPLLQQLSAPNPAPSPGRHH